MRVCLALAFAATLCACSPPAAKDSASAAPPASASAAPPSSVHGPIASTAPVAEGQWVFEGEGNVASSTGFGLPNSESQFYIQCERGKQLVTLGLEHELAPDQDTTMSIRIGEGEFAFPARSHNEGAPMVTAELTPDPRLTALAHWNSPFAVIVGAQTLVLPPDASIAKTLALCGVK